MRCGRIAAQLTGCHYASLCRPADDQRNSVRRRTLEAQLQRLDVDAIDLWILRGFNEEQCSVQEAMATIKVRARVASRCLACHAALLPDPAYCTPAIDTTV